MMWWPLGFCVVLFWAGAQAGELSETDALHYLQKFGYMPPARNDTSALYSRSAVNDAIRDFQRFAGIKITGVLDNETVTMMNMPRCGVKDKMGYGLRARRRRYTLQGSKWSSTNITYKISKFPSRMNRSDVEEEIARAFKVWSDVCPLKFILEETGRVNIDIRFVRGDHGDNDPFNGPGDTLAHAFFPRYGGDVHFDDEEKWTINGYGGVNLFQVAAHEFGHSLGLSHSDVRGSLMAPFYRGYQPGFRLDSDDIDAIQSLYGKRPKTPNSSGNDDADEGSKGSGGGRPKKPSLPAPGGGRPKKPSLPAPDLCQDATIDAATRTEDGNSYVFKGDYYWRVETDGIADGYPRKISDDWVGLPGSIDAALTWSDGKTFFFKGNSYWRFRNKKLNSTYSTYSPKINVGFQGIPANVDAAFVWSGNGKTYFFKGTQYWRYDSRSETPVSKRYPQPISNWNGIPNNIDGAFQWQNGFTYFFKGKTYYRFNDRNFAVDSGSPTYPRSTSVWWFDCKAMSREYYTQRGSLQEQESSAIYLADSSYSIETVVNNTGTYLPRVTSKDQTHEDLQMDESAPVVVTIDQTNSAVISKTSGLIFICLGVLLSLFL